MRTAMVAAAAFAALAGASAAAGWGDGSNGWTGAPQKPVVRGQLTGMQGDQLGRIYEHEADITGPRGKVEKLWIKANHTFLWEGPMGERGHGVWEVRGGEICLSALTEADPMGRARERSSPAPARCAELPSGKGAGDSWRQMNDRGEQIQVVVR